MAIPWTQADIERTRRRLSLGDGPPEPDWAASRVQFAWDGRRRTEYTQAWTADMVADMNDSDADGLIVRTLAAVETILRDRIAEDRAAFRAIRSAAAGKGAAP